jgi:hypothetical protein
MCRSGKGRNERVELCSRGNGARCFAIRLRETRELGTQLLKYLLEARQMLIVARLKVDLTGLELLDRGVLHTGAAQRGMREVQLCW